MYKTIKDIITWIENYSNPKANLEQFALDLADQIRQMSFDLPEGSNIILYSGGFTGADSSANGYMFQSVSRHIQASQGKLSFINDVAENILNSTMFDKTLRSLIGNKTDDVLHGTWTNNTRQRTVFGDKALALDDVISEILVQKHAKGDVAVLMGGNAHDNSVFAKTELPGLMTNERVTHINGIPKEELAGLSSDLERFNRIKAESVAQLSKAEIYRVGDQEFLRVKDGYFSDIFNYETFADSKKVTDSFDSRVRHQNPAWLTDVELGKLYNLDIRKTRPEALQKLRTRHYNDALNTAMKVESKALHASDTKLVIYPDGSMDLASTKSANSRLPEVTVGQLQKYQADPDLVENEAFRKLTAPEQITTERTYKQYTQLLKHIDDMPLDETAKNIYATATGISLDQLSKTDERLIKIGESLTLKKGNAYDKLMEFAKNHERLTNTSNTLLRGMDIGFNVLEAGLVLHDVYKHLHKGDTKGAIGAAIGGSVEWGITNKLGAALTLKLAGLGAVIAGGSVVGLVATTLVAGLIGYGIASYIGSKADELIQQLFASSELVAAPVDPLILDMAGNGFHPTTLGQGAHFDLDQNGFAEKMNWISGDDAMLVIDKNENDIIDDGNEIFGDQTRLKDGQYAKNGFEALREYDSNQDGLISSEDVDFGKLLIWQDNGNAQTEDGELVSLKEAGIQSIQLEYSQFGEESDTGVTFGNTATFTKVDGSQLNIAEYWVKTETHNTIEHNKGSLVGDDAQLPNTASHGALPSLHTAIAMDTSGQLRDMLATFKVTEDAKTRKQQIESILQIIAGATDIADNSRGSRFSAKKLKVVEAFMGRKFIGQNGAEPNANAAKQLETAYQEILQMYYHDLMLQTRVQEVLVMIDQNEKMIRLDQVKEALATVMDESETVQKIGEYAGTLHYLSRYGVKGWEEFRDYYSSQSAIYSKQIALSTNQAIVGDDSGEALTVTAEKSLIYAGAGNDTLNGSNGVDTLYGEDGDDTINGGSGNDTIIGGAGDDTLKGGDDKDDHDVYLFGRGHGKDYLYDEYGTSTIRFTDDIVASDFLVRRDGQHIVLMNQVSGDQLTIAYFASHSTHRRVILEFSDGTVHTIDNQDSIFRNLIGTAADETIDLILSDGGTIRAGAGNDTLNGSNGADTLYGEDGDDTINGGSGNDTIIGGAGDDTLKGGDDKDDHDVYLFGRGHGKDYLYDEYGTSTIRFTDNIVASDFLVRRDGQHIVLMNQVSGDQLTIAYFASHSTHRRVILEFSDGTVHTIDNQDSIFRNLTGTAADETIDLFLSDGGIIRAGAGNDTLNGSNGADTLYGEDGDDTINGGSGNDTIIGGAGDDNLYGGDGDDIYVFGRGHGKDRISDSSGHTTVSFQSGSSADALRVSREGSDLVLSSSETDSIRLSNYHSSSSARDVSMLFADQSTAVIDQTDWTLNVTPASLEAKAFSVEDQVRGARAVLEDAGNTEIVADGMAPTDLSVADQEAAYKAQLATQLLSSLPDRNAAPDTLNSNVIVTEELYTEQFTLGA